MAWTSDDITGSRERWELWQFDRQQAALKFLSMLGADLRRADVDSNAIVAGYRSLGGCIAKISEAGRHIRDLSQNRTREQRSTDARHDDANDLLVNLMEAACDPEWARKARALEIMRQIVSDLDRSLSALALDAPPMSGLKVPIKVEGGERVVKIGRGFL